MRRFERIDKIVDKNLRENKVVLVAGLGGVGGFALESVVRLGIKEVHIFDNDIVDITNLNRQIIALDSTIGQLKVDAFEKRILDINPNCKVHKYSMFLNEENISKILDEIKPDYLLDCIDSLKSKEELIYQSYKRKIKFISSMGTANKVDPTKLKIDKLINTKVDPIARILRKKLKERRVDLKKINVIFSTEVPIIRTSLGSSSVVPSVAGITMTSFILKDMIENG